MACLFTVCALLMACLFTVCALLMACLFTVCALLYLHEEDDDGTEHEHGGPQRGQRARQDGHAHLLQHVTCPR